MFVNQRNLIKIVFLGIITLLIMSGYIYTISNKLEAKGTKDNSFKTPDVSGLQGGYLPKNDIIIDSYKFACIIINVNSEKMIQEILFQIKDRDEKSFAKFFPCMNFVLKSNKLILDPTTTMIGDISFEGTFLPVKNGDYTNVKYDEIVLKGKLKIVNSGKNLYLNNNQEFTFLYGD